MSHPRKHIFNDLQPYVCTNTGPHAKASIEGFSSRSAWIKHETTHVEKETQEIKCSFCPAKKAARPVNAHFKHLSRHLREVALAVLPQSHDSDDSESDPGSTSSKKAMSDISSLRGSEMELDPSAPTAAASPATEPPINFDDDMNLVYTEKGELNPRSVSSASLASVRSGSVGSASVHKGELSEIESEADDETLQPDLSNLSLAKEERGRHG